MEDDYFTEEDWEEFPWLTKLALKTPILKDWIVYLFVYAECYQETARYEVINKGRKRDIDRKYRYKNPEYKKKLLETIHRYEEINQNDWIRPYDE